MTDEKHYDPLTGTATAPAPDPTEAAGRLGYPTLADPGVPIDPRATRLLPAEAAGLAIGYADGVTEVVVDHMPSSAEILTFERATGSQVTVTVTSPHLYQLLRRRADAADSGQVIAALTDLAAGDEVSHIRLTPGSPPLVGNHAQVRVAADAGPVSAADVATARAYLLPADSAQTAVTTWAGHRWRVSVATSDGNPTLTLRRVYGLEPQLPKLGLPAAVADIATLTSGLVLVASPAGQGRTTTLAALLSRLAATRPAWVTWVTGPAETDVPGRRSALTRLVLGVDVPTIAAAAGQALADGTGVLAVDAGTVTAADTDALTRAALAGLLVLVTVPAGGVADAVAAFTADVPASHRDAAFETLARVYQAGLAQVLVPTPGGGLTPAVELWWRTVGVTAALRAGNLQQLAAAALTSDGSGRRNTTLADALTALTAGGRVAVPAT